MYTHRGLTPFINFLPVLVISNTEQHAVLSALGVLRLIKELAILSSSAPYTSTAWYCIHISPFGTVVKLPQQPERLPPPIVKLCGLLHLPRNLSAWLVFTVVTMSLQVRDFYWQHSDGGTSALAFNYWVVFRVTTPFNLPPSKCRPRCLLRQATILQGFSLLSGMDTQRAALLTRVYRPENRVILKC